MCFGIRILSSFHSNNILSEFQLQKHMHGYFIHPSHLEWSLNCVVFALAVQTQSVLAGTCFIVKMKWTQNTCGNLTSRTTLLVGHFLGQLVDSISPTFAVVYRQNRVHVIFCHMNWTLKKKSMGYCRQIIKLYLWK